MVMRTILLKQHDDDRDGHEAWRSLLDWFDGDIIRNETADSNRAKLDALLLHSGMLISM